ncbi:MAG: hypothetical protein ABEJ87_06100 [Candidatus Nanohalobium sp.]
MLQPEIRQVLDARKIIGLALIALIGLTAGFTSAKIVKKKASNGQTYCDRIESQVAQKRNFSGAIACFQPGIVKVNLSKEVKKSSQLKCVCRHSYKGVSQLIPISVSN